MADKEAYNPVNIAIGNFLRTGRSRHGGMSSEALATHFGLSHGHLRRIEDGSQALPARCALGLCEAFNLRWSQACEIVGLTQTVGREDDPSLIFKELHKLRDKIECPHQSRFLELLEKALNEPASRTQCASHMAGCIESMLQNQDVSSQKTSNDPAEVYVGHLSPIIADVVGSMIDRLAHFPPHVSPSGLKEWEKTVETRIVELFGYVSEAQTLLLSVDDFDWKMIWAGARLTLIVGDKQPEEVPDLRTEFVNAMRKRIRSDSKQNRELEAKLDRQLHIAAPGDLTAGIQSALWFDYETRSNPSEFDDTQKQNDPLRFPKFRNAWIYRILPERKLPAGAPPYNVGFLDSHDPMTRTGYAVALDHRHVDIWYNIFQPADI